MQAYAYKPSKPMKIKSVKDLHTRWKNAKMKVSARPDAVCTNKAKKNKSIYNLQILSYREAAEIILDNARYDIENCSLDELELLKQIVEDRN